METNSLKVLLIEPPKDIWFVMGEYLPPPYGIIQLGAYLEKHVENVQLEILDCNAEKVDWAKMQDCMSGAEKIWTAVMDLRHIVLDGQNQFINYL